MSADTDDLDLDAVFAVAPISRERVTVVRADRYRTMAAVIDAAVAVVEAATSHPNNWADRTDIDLIRAVRAHVPGVDLKWLADPQYAGWTDHSDPAPAPADHAEEAP